MKNKSKNILALLSGILLLVALAAYLIQPGSLFQYVILIIVSAMAGYPIFIKAIQALRMRVFSIELLVTIAVIGALIIGEYTESAGVAFLDRKSTRLNSSHVASSYAV